MENNCFTKSDTTKPPTRVVPHLFRINWLQKKVRDTSKNPWKISSEVCLVYFRWPGQKEFLAFQAKSWAEHAVAKCTFLGISTKEFSMISQSLPIWQGWWYCKSWIVKLLVATKLQTLKRLQPNQQPLRGHKSLARRGATMCQHHFWRDLVSIRWFQRGWFHIRTAGYGVSSTKWWRAQWLWCKHGWSVA